MIQNIQSITPGKAQELIKACLLYTSEDCAAAQPRQPRHPCASWHFRPIGMNHTSSHLGYRRGHCQATGHSRPVRICREHAAGLSETVEYLVRYALLRLYGIHRHQYSEPNHVADLQGHLYGKCRHGGRSYAADTIFRNGSRPDWCLLQLFLAILQNRRTQRCRENHFENRVNRHHGGHHRPDGRRSG